MRSGVAYERVEHALAWPMLALSVLIVPVVLLPALWSGMPGSVERSLLVVDVLIWAAFAAEYAVLLALAPDRRKYLLTHVLELVIVVLPMLRPLRLLRSARALRLVAVARAATGSGQATRIARRQLVLTAAIGSPIAVATLLVIGAALVVEAERHAPGANITGYGTALWWSVTTITTVGYGDHYPVTAAGQAVAASMVLLGVTLMGLLTAAVAAVFVSWTTQEAEATSAQTSPEGWDTVLTELAELRAQVAALATSTGPGEQSPNTRPGPILANGAHACEINFSDSAS